MKPTLYKHNGVWKLACRLVPMRGSTLTHPFKKDYQDRELALKDLANLYKAEQVYRGMADLDISSSSQNAPVGTTLALLERQGL